MASRLQRLRRRRTAVQFLATALGNAHLPGFFRGSLYQGPLKRVCLPGLNCYSCPGAIGACPLGALQNSIADPMQWISFYVLAFLLLIGSVLGRYACGWLCPFGWFQELLHRLPGRKIRPQATTGWHRHLRWLKFVLLLLFVFFLPLYGNLAFGYGDPSFCKFICPSGTLMAGIPLLAVRESLRPLVGTLFVVKLSILLLVIVASIPVMRPFCRYLCPLGAVYGLLNRISLYRVQVDWDHCSHCQACTRVCPMSVPVPEDGNTSECIRCGACQAACPENAIVCGFRGPKAKAKSAAVSAD